MDPASATAHSRKDIAADDLAHVVALTVDALGAAPAEAWSQKADALEWDCWETVEHIATALYLYAAQLSRPDPLTPTLIVRRQPPRPGGPPHVLQANRDEGPGGLLELVETHASLLRSVVRNSPADGRGWHPLGISDPEGFATMGVVEAAVHTHDVAVSLDVAWTPPAEVCQRALQRLFPDVTAHPGEEPWPLLRWAAGRGALPGRDRRTEWVWDNSPG